MLDTEQAGHTEKELTAPLISAGSAQRELLVFEGTQVSITDSGLSKASVQLAST